MKINSGTIVAVVVAGCIGLAITGGAEERIPDTHIPLPPNIGTENDMSTVKSEWVSGGMTKSVTTTQLDGESAQDFASRHKAAVDAVKAIYPPD